MTYETLETKLNTAASGFKGFYFDTLDVINREREKRKKFRYPIICILPPKMFLLRGSATSFETDFEFWIFNDLTKANRAAATEVQAWDYINTLASTFKSNVNSDTLLQITDNPIGEPFPEGVTVQNEVAMKYNCKLKVFC